MRKEMSTKTSFLLAFSLWLGLFLFLKHDQDSFDEEVVKCRRPEYQVAHQKYCKDIEGRKRYEDENPLQAPYGL